MDRCCDFAADARVVNKHPKQHWEPLHERIPNSLKMLSAQVLHSKGTRLAPISQRKASRRMQVVAFACYSKNLTCIEVILAVACCFALLTRFPARAVQPQQVVIGVEERIGWAR